MNDNDICIKALTEWPEEARPKFVCRRGQVWHVDTLPVPLDSAISLFEISGLKWLLALKPKRVRRVTTVFYDDARSEWVIEVWKRSTTDSTYGYADDPPEDDYASPETHRATTLLSAIDAAIRATTKGRAGA